MALFGLDKKVKNIVLDTLADGEVKDAVNKMALEATARLLDEISSAIKTEINRSPRR
jgi:Mg/Co/Ni transporter MgtE